MKKIILAFLILGFFAGHAVSQDIESKPINFKKLKKEIKKKKSLFYYPNLFQRYLDLDTSLTAEDFRYLYYGYTFQSDYSPYGTPKLRDSLKGYLAREDMMQSEYAISGRIAGDLLKESPFRLRETFIAAVAYEMAGNEDLSNRYYLFYENQVEAIMSTGDGLTEETALAVIYVSDEYEMLEVLGFKFGGQQALIGDGYDELQLEENRHGITHLYFDVRRLFKVGF